MENSFTYMIYAGGVNTEDSYPYKGEFGSCRYSRKNIGAIISSYQRIQYGDESALRSAVALQGPISVAVDGSHNTFRVS